MTDFAKAVETAKGFKAAAERIDDAECSIEELKGVVEQFSKMLKVYGKAALSGGGDGEYAGFWPNEQMAKDFGGIVMAACGKAVEGCPKDMGTLVAEGGGNLVPEDMSTWIIQKLGKYGKFRKNTLPVKLSAGRQFIPKVVTDMVIYLPGEGQEITKSDMKFGMVQMDVRKFACIAVVNRELDEDSVVGLGEIIGLSITRSMAKKEDLIGFMGDGTEVYFGMSGIVGAFKKLIGLSEGTVSNVQGLKVATGNAYSEITLGDFRGVVAILPEDADDDAKWFMNKKFYYDVVYPLAETAGVASIFEILSASKARYLLGYPVEFVSCMPKVEADSQICAVLGDLKIGAFLGERKQLHIDRSDEAYFTSDQIGIRGIERIDINVYGAGDVNDAGEYEAGPIVGLITKDS